MQTVQFLKIDGMMSKINSGRPALKKWVLELHENRREERGAEEWWCTEKETDRKISREIATVEKRRDGRQSKAAEQTCTLVKGDGGIGKHAE